MQLDAFTPEAQQALLAAQDIVQQQQHTQLDVEHIFLALLRQPDGLAASALARLNVDASTIAQQIEHELTAAPKVQGTPVFGQGNQIYVTPRTQRLLKHAADMAGGPGEQPIGREHLLAAIAAEPQGVTPHMLQRSGVDYERMYRVLVDICGSGRLHFITPQPSLMQRMRQWWRQHILHR
jgi:ATP-dependent Clp protease ATP-binding subunit ClpC